jgi:uncharacterized protein involved in type VI secretion and phage assembly
MPLEQEEMLVSMAETMRSRFYGKYRGKVVDVNDPDTLGRITANVPEVLHEETSPWALPAVPFAGPSHGLVLIPEVGDGVWIEFEAGDPSRPIWTGGWWAKNELPSPGGTEVRVLVTSKGHQLVIDDKNKEIKVVHAGGAELKLTDNDISLKIGNTEITMSKSDLTLKVGSSAQVKLSASGTAIS